MPEIIPPYDPDARVLSDAGLAEQMKRDIREWYVRDYTPAQIAAKFQVSIVFVNEALKEQEDE